MVWLKFVMDGLRRCRSVPIGCLTCFGNVPADDRGQQLLRESLAESAGPSCGIQSAVMWSPVSALLDVAIL